MKRVKLFSQVTRMVYPALSYDKTNAIQQTALGAIQVQQVSQTWADKGIKIEEGLHEYDESVLQIKAVKDLIDSNLVIIKSEDKNSKSANTGKAKKTKETSSLADTANELESEEEPVESN